MMDFNFLSNHYINCYQVSPLVGPNYQSDPFEQEEYDDGFFFQPKLVPSVYNIENKNDKNIELSEKDEEENQIGSLNISPKISGIMQSHNNLFKEDNKLNLLFEEEKKQKSTNITTEKANNGKIQLKEKKIFGLKSETKSEILPRIDYAIKNFKVNAVKFIKNKGNELIKKCKFKGELKKTKLFSPSNKYFTGIPNEKENKKFLGLTLAEVFSYPNEDFGKDNRLQQSNKKAIQKMKDTINEQDEIPEECQDLLDFFEMTFEDAIILFYKSEQFLTYKETEKAKYLDSQFIKVKGFSLFECNSFVSMLKHGAYNSI